MDLAVSSLIMLAIFMVIALAEWKGAQRTKDFFRRTEPQIAKLAERAAAKYRARYGKDPTQNNHTHAAGTIKS